MSRLCWLFVGFGLVAAAYVPMSLRIRTTMGTYLLYVFGPAVSSLGSFLLFYGGYVWFSMVSATSLCAAASCYRRESEDASLAWLFNGVVAVLGFLVTTLVFAVAHHIQDYGVLLRVLRQ
jgi:hypothetical protein